MAKKTKFNIGLDLDGVIIDHTENKIKIAKSFGFKIGKKETQSEVLKKLMPEDKYRKLQRIIYGKITLDAPSVSSALKILQKLSKDAGYELFIISRRGKGKQGVNSARNWFKKYRFYEIIPKKNIVFVQEAGDKNFWCEKFNIKIYMDDKVKVLDGIYSVPFPIFFNPRSAAHNKKYLEIKSWKEFPKLLKNLKRFSLC